MKLSTDVTRFATLMIMLGAVGSLAISSVPIASAMNSPDYDRDPLTPFQDQVVTITFTGDDGGTAPHDAIVFRVLEPPLGITPVNNDENDAEANFPVTGQCDPLKHDGDQIAWELRRDANTDTFYTMSERVSFTLQDGDEISAKFGQGDPDFTITDLGGATTTVFPASGDYAWVQVADANGDPDVTGGTFDTDNTNTIGNGGYRHGICGSETGGALGLIVTFTVSERIAGTVIPVDTTALLIAGATTNALWILPMIGVAAVGFGIFTLKRK